jgi:hypothetical protein
MNKILNESIDDKINELTSRLEEKINILEVDAHNLEYEQAYEFDNPNGRPKRVIFKGRGRKGKGDSETQTYHFEDDKGHDIMLSKKGVLNKIKNADKEMKKENEEFTEGNAFTKKLKDTEKGGKFKIGNKTYIDKSELEEKLYGGQKKLDKNKNGKIDSEDFEMLRKHNKSEVDEMGGMDDVHPRFGKKNFSKMSHEEILNLLTQKLEDDEDESGTEMQDTNRLEEAKKFIQKAVEKMDKKGTSGKFDKNIGGFKGTKNESVIYKLALTENTSMELTEDELIDMIEELVIEAKENEKYSGKAKGMVEYERVAKKNKRENSDALKAVEKKMKDYLKDGSKGEYSMNPKHFPKGNGELGKMDKKAYIPSKDVEEYVDDYAYPGMTNLNYDEIKPNDEWVEANIKGSAKTGNSDEYANAVKTDVGEKMVKNYKKNAWGKQQKNASYKRQSQPVDYAGENTPKKTALDKLSENFEVESNKLIIEEFEKIQHLMSYKKKTQ